MKIKKFQNEQTFIKESISFIAQACSAKKTTDQFHKAKIVRIAFSGGATPEPIYKALSLKKNIPFGKIELYQVDERYVPKNHKDSNQKMIETVLIKPLKKNIKAFHPFDTSLPIQKSLQKYETLLKKIPQGSFDLIILGIGPDGHTASLFPKTEALQEKKRLVAHTTTDQFAVKDRLTLTFPSIMKSKKILVLLKGAEKEKILQKILSPQSTMQNLPAKKLLQHKAVTVHLLK